MWPPSGAELVTTDLDEGVTPAFVACPDPLCNLLAASAFYRIEADPLGEKVPTHAWYRPDKLPKGDMGVRHHLEQGGLLMRELTAEERAVFEPAPGPGDSDEEEA